MTVVIILALYLFCSCTRMHAQQGMRVVRGKDWEWDDQDGGEGMLGTIVDINYDLSSKQALVMWDNGFNGCYDVERPGQSKIVAFEVNHHGIRKGFCCNGCNCISKGFQWNCMTCADVHLCTPCYMDDVHDITHQFRRFKSSSKQWDTLPSRCTSQKIQSKGLFKGASVTLSNLHISDITKTGKLVQYFDNRNFKFCSANVLWNDACTPTIYYLGQDRMVDIKCIIPANGAKYYKGHLPCFYKEDTVRPRSLSVKTYDTPMPEYSFNDCRFLSLQIAAGGPQQAYKLSDKARKSKSLDKLRKECQEGSVLTADDEIFDSRDHARTKTSLQSEFGGEAMDFKLKDQQLNGASIEQIQNISKKNGIYEAKLDRSYRRASSSKTAAKVATSAGKTKKAQRQNIIKDTAEIKGDVSKCCLCKIKVCNVEIEPCSHSFTCSDCVVYFKKCYRCKRNIIGHLEKTKNSSSETDRTNKFAENRSSTCCQDGQISTPLLKTVNSINSNVQCPQKVETMHLSMKCNMCNVSNKDSSCHCGLNMCDKCSDSTAVCRFCNT